MVFFDLPAKTLKKFHRIIALGPIDEKVGQGAAGVGESFEHDVEAAFLQGGDFVPCVL